MIVFAIILLEHFGKSNRARSCVHSLT